MARWRETLSDYTRRVTHHGRDSIEYIIDESSLHLHLGNLEPVIMPTYYSRSTTIQLGVADLQDTTTIELESRSRSAVYDEVTSCAAKFARASINGTLDETPILTEDASQTHARFLGQFSNMPFFMVRAGMGFFNSEAEGRRTRRPARVPPLIIDPVSSPQSPSSLRPPAASHKKEAGDANKSGGCENGQHNCPISYHFLFAL